MYAVRKVSGLQRIPQAAIFRKESIKQEIYRKIGTIYLTWDLVVVSVGLYMSCFSEENKENINNCGK